MRNISEKYYSKSKHIFKVQLTKATNTHSEYIIFSPSYLLYFHDNNVCTNAPQCYVCAFNVCRFSYVTVASENSVAQGKGTPMFNWSLTPSRAQVKNVCCYAATLQFASIEWNRYNLWMRHPRFCMYTINKGF